MLAVQHIAWYSRSRVQSRIWPAASIFLTATLEGELGREFYQKFFKAKESFNEWVNLKANFKTMWRYSAALQISPLFKHNQVSKLRAPKLEWNCSSNKDKNHWRLIKCKRMEQLSKNSHSQTAYILDGKSLFPRREQETHAGPAGSRSSKWERSHTGYLLQD